VTLAGLLGSTPWTGDTDRTKLLREPVVSLIRCTISGTALLMVSRSVGGMVDVAGTGVVTGTGVVEGVGVVVEGPQDGVEDQGGLVVLMVELWSTTNAPSASSLADHSTCGFSEKATLNFEYSIGNLDVYGSEWL